VSPVWVVHGKSPPAVRTARSRVERTHAVELR